MKHAIVLALLGLVLGVGASRAHAARGPVETLADLVGDSPAIAAVREQVRRLLQRQSESRRLPPILNQGETGTGKGFTDARQSKPGLCQVAHRGTQFLDEVGLLPEGLQAKLLTAPAA